MCSAVISPNEYVFIMFLSYRPITSLNSNSIFLRSDKNKSGKDRFLSLSEISSIVLVSDKFLHSLLPARNYSISGHLKLFSNPIISVSMEQMDVFREDILMIQKRVSDIDHKFYDEMIGGLLRTLVYDFFDIHSEFSEAIPESNRASEISRQFFLMLESGRVKYDREPERYASALSVSRKYLNAVIKRQTGSTVSYHINRTARAMIIDYLKENKLSISQIADEMNFTSLEYFSRYCKKHLGISPSSYRLSQK